MVDADMIIIIIIDICKIKQLNMTDPNTLQDVLEFQEFYRHRTCNLGNFSMTFYDWPLCLYGPGSVSNPNS